VGPFVKLNDIEKFSVICTSCGVTWEIRLAELVRALLAWECPECDSTRPPRVDRGSPRVQ
jgi:predicted RNA-binding Zn-ribbon protein involved in translation (DUF1610 family)